MPSHCEPHKRRGNPESFAGAELLDFPLPSLARTEVRAHAMDTHRRSDDSTPHDNQCRQNGFKSVLAARRKPMPMPLSIGTSAKARSSQQMISPISPIKHLAS